MTKKELFEEFKKFTSPGTGLNLIDIQRAAIFEWFYIKMENRENDWTKMIRMMGVLVTTEAMVNKIIEQDQEMNGLIEIHHEQCKELELEIQSLKEQLQKANEIIDQLTKQQLTNETNR